MRTTNSDRPAGAPWPIPEAAAFLGISARHLARLAAVAAVGAVPGVTFDEGNYDRVRLWRLANSRHPRTGLHKVRLAYDELMGLSPAGVRALAAAPRPYSPRDPAPDPEPQLRADWEDAVGAVERERQERAERQHAEPAAGGPDRLNRATLDFVRDGAGVGDRHRRLFSAAANLGAFGCPPRLACALLMPAALDTGLAPADAARQIECGLRHAAGALEGGGR